MAEEPDTNERNKASDARPKKKRHWLRRILITLGVLGLIIWLLPYVISTGVFNDLILDAVNDKIDQTVSIGKISLNWLGPCGVENVKVLDWKGREFVQVGRVTASGGLWHAMVRPLNFGTVSVESPRVVVYLGEPPKPEKPDDDDDLLGSLSGDDDDDDDDEDDAPPAPVGEVRIRDGFVRLVQPDGRALEIRDLQGEVALDTLDKLRTEMSLGLSTGGKASLSVKLSGVLPTLDGEAGPKGDFRIRTDEQVDLGKLVAFLDKSVPFEGMLNADVSGTIAGKNVTSKLLVTASGLRSARPEHVGVKPMDLKLDGNVRTADAVAGVDLTLTSTVGRFDIRASVPLDAEFKAPTTEDLLAAVLAEQGLPLPEASVTGKGRLSLVRLAQAVPALLKVLPGVRVTGGELVLKELAFSGGAQPRAKVQAELGGLKAVRDGRTLSYRPVVLSVDAVLGDRGLVVENSLLAASFARATAAGTSESFAADFDVRLDELNAELGRTFDLSALPKKGSVTGKLTLNRASDDRVKTLLRVTIKDFEHVVNAKRIRVEQAEFWHEGYVVIADKRPVKLVAEGGGFTLAEHIELAHGGAYDFAGKAFEADIDVKRADLEGLTRWARSMNLAEVPQCFGALACRAKLSRADEKAPVVVDVSEGKLRGMQVAADGGGRPVGTIDANFGARVKAGPKRTVGRVVVKGSAVTLDATFDYTPVEKALKITTGDILAAVFDGRALPLPGLTLDAKSRTDLGLLAQAAPKLASPSPDVRITGGIVDVKELAVRGGAFPSVKANIAWSKVALTRKDKTIGPESGLLDVDLSLHEGTGLRIGKTVIDSAVGGLKLTGTSKRIQATYTVDLAAVGAKARAVSGKDVPLSAGSIVGEVTLSKVKNGVDFEGKTTAAGLVYKEPGREGRLKDIVVTHAGRLALDEFKPLGVRLTSATVNIQDDLSVAARGEYDVEHKKYQAALTVARADIGKLVRLVRSFGVDVGNAAGKFAGVTEARIDVNGTAGGPVASKGTVTVRGLQVDTRPVGDTPIVLRWTDLAYAPERFQLDAADVRLTSPFATLKIANLHGRFGSETISLSGNTDLTADLAACMTVARPFLEDKPGEKGQTKEFPQVAGTARWQGTFGTTGARTKINSTTTVDNLRITRGQAVFEEKALRITQTAEIDADTRTLDLKAFDLKSSLFAVNAAGTVEKFDTEQVMDLRGTYTGSWDDIMKLIRVLSPDAAKAVVIEGDTGGAFVVKGPAKRPKAVPAFLHLIAHGPVKWKSITVDEFLKIEAPPEDFEPKLADGQVTIPTASLPANGGKINLGGRIDYRDKVPAFHMPGRTVVLEGLQIDRKTGEKFLSRINPFFAQMAELEGSLTLEVSDLVWPLEEKDRPKAAAVGTLNLEKLKLKPEGFAADVIKYIRRRVESEHTATVKPVKFSIRSGRVHCDDFTIRFGKDESSELRFRGSVGFDDTLDMKVSIPVSQTLMAQLGVRGPILEYVGKVLGSHVTIPIGGTRQKPKLNWSKFDIKPIITRATTMMLMDRLAPKKDTDAPKDPDTPKDKDKPSDKTSVPLDEILDILRDQLERRRGADSEKKP